MNPEITEIKGYNLKLFQHKKGYRFSIDAFLLAWFVSREKFKNGYEIGAGNGVVSFLVDRMTKDKKHFELIEIQPSLCRLIEKNLELNRFKSDFVLRCEDARFVLPFKNPDIVYLNPPFTDFKKGKVSPNVEKALARHRFFLDINSVFKWFLENTGKNSRLALIEKSENLSEYLKSAESFGLYPVRVVDVKPFEEKNPNLFLALFSKTNGNFKREFLTIYSSPGKYTDKVKKILGIL